MEPDQAPFLVVAEWHILLGFLFGRLIVGVDIIMLGSPCVSDRGRRVAEG